LNSLHVEQGLASTIVEAIPDAALLRDERRKDGTDHLPVAAPPESPSNFRTLFDETPEGVLLSDRENFWTDVNPAACRMFGYAREELVGRYVFDLIPPEDYAQIAPARERLNACPACPVTVEHSIRRKDGTLLPVEVRVKLFSDGRYYAFMRDITLRRRAEQERDECLRWLRAVLDQSPVALAVMHGPRFEQLEFNARAEELLGPPCHTDCDPPARLHDLEGRPVTPGKLPVEEALRGKRIMGADYLVTSLHNGLTPIRVNAGPITDPEGTVVGAVVAFEDISAVKELERLRAEWSSVVAHDLRQPLGAIVFNAQLLARISESPSTQKYAERIHAASTRLNRMVGDLMDLSRVEARRMELVRQRVDVAAVLRHCVEQARFQAPDRPIDVLVEGEVPDAYADPDRLAQVLDNLLTNAVKYGLAGSRITATVAHDGGEVAVSIANEGHPLPAQEMTHIFDRFQRGQAAKLDGIKGDGLGLYITRSLVEAHGGRIAAESTPAGMNTFRFTLPVAADPAASSR
jgi:PAS domain S-box-containing protein